MAAHARRARAADPPRVPARRVARRASQSLCAPPRPEDARVAERRWLEPAGRVAPGAVRQATVPGARGIRRRCRDAGEDGPGVAVAALEAAMCTPRSLKNRSWSNGFGFHPRGRVVAGLAVPQAAMLLPVAVDAAPVGVLLRDRSCGTRSSPSFAVATLQGEVSARHGPSQRPTRAWCGTSRQSESSAVRRARDSSRIRRQARVLRVVAPRAARGAGEPLSKRREAGARRSAGPRVEGVAMRRRIRRRAAAWVVSWLAGASLHDVHDAEASSRGGSRAVASEVAWREDRPAAGSIGRLRGTGPAAERRPGRPCSSRMRRSVRRVCVRGLLGPCRASPLTGTRSPAEVAVAAATGRVRVRRVKVPSTLPRLATTSRGLARSSRSTARTWRSPTKIGPVVPVPLRHGPVVERVRPGRAERAGGDRVPRPGVRTCAGPSRSRPAATGRPRCTL